MPCRSGEANAAHQSELAMSLPRQKVAGIVAEEMRISDYNVGISA